uniref:Maturase n=1 Tax=Silene noctiflora TaxID=39899 RepID=G8E8T1_9CARY|nr:maturase [Silene noctiflora]AJP34458.1 maturase [Silene noctiflora]AJP34471.1 maturase [Silene noctiflora]
MKEAIRMVPESLYDPKFADTSGFRSGRGCHSALRRIKEEWGTSRWFLEFDIRKYTIDRHRLIPILKEEIDDTKFFYSIQKIFYAGAIKTGEKGNQYVPQSILLSALPGNIYLQKLDQEIARIRQKYEITIAQRIRYVLLKETTSDEQENYKKEKVKESCRATQENRSISLDRQKSIQRKAAFHYLLPSWQKKPTSTQRVSRDQTSGLTPASDLAVFLNKSSSLLIAALLIEAPGFTPKDKFYGIKCSQNNWHIKEENKSKRKGLLIELGESERVVLRSEKVLGKVKGEGEVMTRKPEALKRDHLIKIAYARYADEFLLGIGGDVELLIEIEKRISHFLQYGLNLYLGSAGARRRARRSQVEFLGIVIREVAPKPTPIQFLRELEKRLRVKSRIQRTACNLRSVIHSKFRNLGRSIPSKELTKGIKNKKSLLDAGQLADSLRTARVRSPQVSILWETVKHIRQGSREISFLHRSGQSKVPSHVQEAVSRSAISRSKFSQKDSLVAQKAASERTGHRERSSRSEFPIPRQKKIEAPIKKLVKRLRDRGLISRRRPWPIHVACLTNVSDGDIINWFAGIAISPMSYYRCCDNLDQVRTIVDYQIRWSAIFTLAHKHKSSARNIIPKYSKDLKIVNKEGGQILAEYPNSRELRKLEPEKEKKEERSLNY